MGIFDLLFICVFLTTVTLLLVAVFSPRRLSILRWLGTGLAIYFGIVIVTSLLLPRKLIAVGENQCFDDWCIAVEGVDQTPTHSNVAITARLRLSSRARRVDQRENNLKVYVLGGSGERYEASADNTAVPFNVLLQPGEWVTTSRTFLVPKDVSDPALVITHRGGFPISWFIIGYDSWFRPPPVLPVSMRKFPAAS